MGAVEGRKISDNNQAAEVPARLFLRLVERLPLPLGHLGPDLAWCHWHALGEPLFHCRSVIRLLLAAK